MECARVRFKRLIGAAGVVVVAAGLAAGVSSAATSKVAVCATIGEGTGVQTALIGTGYYSGSGRPGPRTCDTGRRRAQRLRRRVRVPGLGLRRLQPAVPEPRDLRGRRRQARTRSVGIRQLLRNLVGTASTPAPIPRYTGSNVKDFSGSLGLVIEDPSSPIVTSVASVRTQVVAVSRSARALRRSRTGRTAQPAVALKGNVDRTEFLASRCLYVGRLGPAARQRSPPARDRYPYPCSVEPGGLLLGAGEHDAGRYGDPARDVPRPGREPAVETDSRYDGELPAFYYQGKGISCDYLPGYTRTGEMVGYGGHGDPGGYIYMALG